MAFGSRKSGEIVSVPDLVFNGVFLLEFVLKVIALGFYKTGSSAYIRNSWNIADLVILFGSLICECVSVHGKRCA